MAIRRSPDVLKHSLEGHCFEPFRLMQMMCRGAECLRGHAPGGAAAHTHNFRRLKDCITFSNGSDALLEFPEFPDCRLTARCCGALQRHCSCRRHARKLGAADEAALRPPFPPMAAQVSHPSQLHPRSLRLRRLRRRCYHLSAPKTQPPAVGRRRHFQAGAADAAQCSRRHSPRLRMKFLQYCMAIKCWNAGHSCDEAADSAVHRIRIKLQSSGV